MKRTGSLSIVMVAAVGLAACGTGETEAAEAAQRRSLSNRPPAEQELPPTPLNAEVTSRDLGTVGIGDGLVETEFTVTNTADAPTELAAAYTSCMCTEVTLAFRDGTTAGPFGMPGHELPVTLTRTLEPGEAFTARATFDPMAHGPDAVGPVHRAIALHSGNGGMLQLDFSVNVVKDVSQTGPS